MSKQLILASTSPRRKELLQQIGIEFTQLAININEDVRFDEKPADYVLRLAKEKSIAGFNALSTQQQVNSLVLAADTTVVCDELILAKPESLEDCQKILGQLSGREHCVKTAIGLCGTGISIQKVVTTQVKFRELSETEIEIYWHTGEPQDKAGSYGIQGFAAVFVESIIGSYSNVVGLPLCETAALLNQFNIPLWQDRASAGAII
ncbi:MAG: septum formation protein [Arenicella sp.]|jgi:septum formation protein